MVKKTKIAKKPNGYWTKEAVIAEAQKYTTPSEFRKNARGATWALYLHPEWKEEVYANLKRVSSWGELVIHRALMGYGIKHELQKRFTNIRDKYPLPFDFYLPQLNLVIEYQGVQHFEDSYRTGKHNFRDRQKKDRIKRDGAKRYKIAYLAIHARKEADIEAQLMQKIRQIAKRKDVQIRKTKRTLTREELEATTYLGRKTKEEIIAQAQQYEYFSDWCKASQSYQIAYANGYIKECQAHMRSEFESRSRAQTKWTKEACLKDAKPFKSRSEWKAHNGPAYKRANENGWLDEVCAHMERKIKPNNYWTLDRLKEDARRFKTRNEWQKNSSGYSRALELGLLEKCCKHMVQLQKPHGYWNKERSLAAAKKCKTRTQFMRTYPAAYKKIVELGLIEEAQAHMIQIQTPPGYWTKERIIESAKPFPHKGKWIAAHKCAYLNAQKLGIVDLVTKHMTAPCRIRKWTKEAVLADAKRFKTRKQWQEGSSAYSVAHKKGWLEEACAHMAQLVKPPNYWNQKTLLADAKQYTQKSEWRANSSGAYTIAHRLGIIDLCAKHMIDGRAKSYKKLSVGLAK